MNTDNTRLVYSCSFFLLSFVLVVISKPSMIFDKYGRVKELGSGPYKDKTMFSLGVVTMLLATICFYVFCFMDIALSTEI